MSSISVTPGCTRTLISSSLQEIILFIRAVHSTIPPSAATAPPARPVPAPRTVTGSLAALQRRRSSETCSSSCTYTTASGTAVPYSGLSSWHMSAPMLCPERTFSAPAMRLSSLSISGVSLL